MSRIYYRGARAAVVCYGKGTENGSKVPGQGGGDTSGSGIEEQCQHTLIPLPRSHRQWEFPASKVLGERASKL